MGIRLPSLRGDELMKKTPHVVGSLLGYANMVMFYVLLWYATGLAYVLRHKAVQILTAVHESETLGVLYPLTACFGQIVIGCLLLFARRIRYLKWLSVSYCGLFMFWVFYLAWTFYEIVRIGGVSVPK